MNTKKFFYTLGLFLLALPTWAGTEYDYGDAPDGVSTAYDNGVTGAFPSELASNGARTLTVDEVWLGQRVNTENDSRQVDADRFDDGVDLKLKSCARSRAVFLVQVANPGEMTGTAYLNLFADWDQSGEWSGADDCAPEWAVRNFPVDLSAQTQAIAVYVPAFTAGKNVKNIWFRAVVTKDQRLYDETSAGSFTSGEVEDYGPAVPEKGGSYAVKCQPDPLIIAHGDAGKITIVEKPGTTPFSSIGFPNSSDPNGDGKYQDKNKKVSIAGADSVTVKSKRKHPATAEKVSVPISVRYADGTRIIKTCPVIIMHSALKAVNQDSHNYTLTEFDPSRVTFTEAGEHTIMSGVISPRETYATEMLSLQITGFEVPLTVQNPALPDPVAVDLNINNDGWPSDWTCEMTTDDDNNSVKHCAGTSTYLTSESSFDIYFNSDSETQNKLDRVVRSLETPEQLHLHLLTADGDTLAVDMPLGE